MQNIKHGRGLFAKGFIFIMLTLFSSSVFAEYYFITGNPGPLFRSDCFQRVYVRKRVYRVHYVRKYHHRRHIIGCGYRYYRPCYRPVYPSCGGCGARVVRRMRCGSCMPSYYARPACNRCGYSGYYRAAPGYMANYYPYVRGYDYSNVYPDQATGDDNPMYDPGLNIDR